MSRTYRKTEEIIIRVHGVDYSGDDWRALPYDQTLGWNFDYKYIKTGRDRKPWNKPPSWFKKSQQRQRRAQIKHYMDKEQYDLIPNHPNSDQWRWT